MTVKNIIFDLGNVIVDIDAAHTQRGLSALGIEKAQDIFSVQQQNALCDRFECGLISKEAFIAEMGRYSIHENVDLDAVQKAWESMILLSHPDRLRLLEACRKDYRVFLLSNTNQIHYDHLNKIFAAHYNISCLDDLFDKAYYSFNVGLRKPMPEIFTHVLDEQKLDPTETLFIDDLEKNIHVAKNLQIKTWHATDIEAAWQYVSSLIT